MRQSNGRVLASHVLDTCTTAFLLYLNNEDILCLGFQTLHYLTEVELIGKLESLSASCVCVFFCLCDRQRDCMISGLYMFFSVITVFTLYCYDMKF